ncbi:MAG TPA: hypothetical protein VJN01_10045 [Xanthomonadales bacterium]|nr:hypothetical protein [Xanthomonadales bacterium]
MTELRPGSRNFRCRPVLQVLCAITLLGTLPACGREEAADYCKNHYQVHAQHADSIARLHGTLDADGLLTMRLSLPTGVFGSGPNAAERSATLRQLLQSPEQVYRLETDQPCAAATVKVNELDLGMALEYQSQCGAGNRVKQVNVELFALLDKLEEVEVQMDTAATSKHFAISRLCEQAIFRLKKPGQD